MTGGMATLFETLSDREIRMSRVFDAPRDLVYKAYTDPEIVPLWWGQDAATTTVDAMDVVPGGLWRYTQRDDNGNEYSFNGEYREVTPPARLVNTFEFEGMPGHVIEDTTVFEELDGKTRISVTSRFATTEDLQGMMASGMEAGANESWDRLARYLATQSV